MGQGSKTNNARRGGDGRMILVMEGWEGVLSRKSGLLDSVPAHKVLSLGFTGRQEQSLSELAPRTL